MLLLMGVLPRAGRAQSVVLEQWALTANNSATLASAGTVATVPTLTTGAAAPLPTNNLTTANGTTVPAVAAYSGLGQALAPAADGGSWGNSTASPPTRYEEFTYTVAPGYAARLDSLVFSTALSGGSNGRVGVSYSIDGFANTTYLSGSLSSGLVSNGASLNATNNVTAATDAYTVVRLALSGSTGLKLAAGSTVAFRLYYGVSTSNTGRYALLRSFSVKGQSITIGSVGATTASATFAAASGYTYAISTTPAGGTATLATAPSSANGYTATYDLSGLAPATAYTATVVGTRSAAPTTTTITSASFTTQSSSQPCAAATGLAVGSITTSTASVSFTPGASNVSYTLTYYPTSTPASAITVSPAPTASPVALTGLTAGTAYTVTLQSACSNGGISATSTQTFTTTAVACADPSGLAVSGATSTSASVGFTPGAGNASYVVTYYPTSTPASAITVSPAPTASPVALTGLTAGTPYTVTLQSICSNGASTSVQTTTFTTASLSCSNPNSATAITNVTGTTARVDIVAGTNNVSYAVTYYPSGNPGATVTVTSSTTPIDLVGLTPNTSYLLNIKSNCVNGGTSTGINRNFSTPSVACADPTSVAVGSITNSSASLSFTPGASNTSYTVAYYPTATPAAVVTVSPAPTASPVALTSLTANTAYTVTLQSTCSNGSSGTVITRTFTTLAPSACDAPTGAAVGSITATSASLSFVPGASNASYVVTYYPTSTPASAITVAPAPTASPVALTGLTGNTAYTVTLQSTCSNGQLSAVQTLTFTTLIPNFLQQWSLKVSDADSAGIRSAAVAASISTMRQLVPSNGTTVAAYPARSARYGQAFAPTADGLWTTAVGGPGSNPNRTIYRQFVIKPGMGSVRVDSLVLWAAMYNTTGKMAVVYSKTGFKPSTPGGALDSVDVAGGKGPSGALPGSASGAFAAPVALANQNTGPNQAYRFALNTPGAAPAAGVALHPGDSLTVRVYFSTGSSSNGRYALLKDVYTIGQSIVTPLPVTLTSFTATRQGGAAALKWTTATEINNEAFEVEVATGTQTQFRSIGRLAGAGNGQTAHTYQFLDTEEGKKGLRYYRLRQVDKDGTTTYSSLRSVLFDGGTATALQVSPNPFHSDAVALTTQANASARTTLRLTDALGRTVRTQELTVPAGSAQLTVSGLSGLPAGLYLLHLTLDGRPQQVKLVRE
ncbi:beta strand repeat-containing protein [Hymenobacter ruricola]|uniref:Fibronectin type III domain-containing protein n=1 Tax=Hymenobacter ruricola TaxID=2791023 RepID=A0ABS0I4H7_9BACT|nr:fibronectin type III domain-containing protein [Hymenobacter ruricola]MBF9221847.1 fibronectin type III domain-containing protein [Hymenobacter ruricola]